MSSAVAMTPPLRAACPGSARGTQPDQSEGDLVGDQGGAHGDEALQNQEPAQVKTDFYERGQYGRIAGGVVRVGVTLGVCKGLAFATFGSDRFDRGVAAAFGVFGDAVSQLVGQPFGQLKLDCGGRGIGGFNVGGRAHPHDDQAEKQRDRRNDAQIHGE